MKKPIFKFVLTKKDIKTLRNKKGTTAASWRNPIVLLAVIRRRIIKGKLGFTIDTADKIFLFKSKAIFDAITLNTGGFYSPAFSSLTVLGTQNDDFEQAISNMSLGVLGAEGAKITAKNTLKDTLDEALIYINRLARANQSAAIEMITGACMEVVRNGSYDKPGFAVKLGNGTGEIKLIAKSVKVDGKYVKATYFWQYSIDDGKTWEDLEQTLVAKALATGMLAGVPTVFRTRSKSTKGGLTPWSGKIEITPR